MKKFLIVLALAVPAAGCASSENTVTEGDRQIEDMVKQSLEEARVLFTKTREAQEKNGPSWTIHTAGLQNLEDALKGMNQLRAVHGPPKDPKKYTQKDMEDAISKSKDEHSKLTWWAGAVGLIGAAGAWFLRNVGLRAIPVIGPLLANLAPNLTNGATQNDKIAMGAQVVLDEGRKKIDELLSKLTEKIPDSVLLGELKKHVPDLKDIAIKEMERLGVLTANTRLYEANPGTGDATKT